MSFELIDPKDAPLPRKQPSRTASVSQQMIQSLAPGKVGKITLAKSQNVRGMKVSLTRAAQRLGKQITLWDVDGVVYMQLDEE